MVLHSTFDQNLQAKPHILCVGKISSFGSSLDSKFLKSNFQIRKAKSVISGIDMLKTTGPYSVILFNNRELSNTSYKSFLGQLREFAPLTSRIMVSSDLSIAELKSKVTKGDIHSYYRDETPSNTNTAKIAVVIGHNFYFNNVLWRFVDQLDKDSIIKNWNIQKYENIIDWLKLQNGFEDDCLDFTGRELELNQLGKGTKSICDSISNFQNQLFDVRKVLKEDPHTQKSTQIKQFTEKIQCDLELLGEKIDSRAKHIQRITHYTNYIADVVSVRENKIIQLKNEIKLEVEVVRSKEGYLNELAELGETLLIGANFNRMLENTAIHLAKILGMKFVSILEYHPESKSFTLQAGVGWKERLVDNAKVEAGLKSLADHTLLSKHPVIMENIETETRFSVPSYFLEQGITSGISISVSGENHPYGVIAVHSTCLSELSREEVKLLKFISNIFALGIRVKKTQQSEHKITEGDTEYPKDIKKINDYEIVISELINQCHQGKQKVIDIVQSNLKISIFPLLSRMRLDCEISSKSIDNLEICLHGIVGKTGNILLENYAFTAKEAEIGIMIKNDLCTKQIAFILKVSSRTVENHRNKMRKKLGLSGKTADLRSYLVRLE